MSDEHPNLTMARILKTGIERRKQKRESLLAAPNGSATPRTDEEVRLCRVKSSAFGDMVGADFAARLEMELACAMARLEECHKIQDSLIRSHSPNEKGQP